MDNYKFRSDEFYNHPLAEIEESAPVEKIEKEVIANLRIRKEPDGEILGNFKIGTKVVIINEEDGWSELEDGRFVMSKYLK